jgi:hypothetical protein
MFPLNFLNKNIIYLRNKKIEEYDIQQGGYSCALKYELLSDGEIVLLSNFNKKERHIYLGNKAKEERNFTKELHECFRKEIDNFIEINEIPHSNILSIKKDSITFYNSKIKNTNFEEVIFTQRSYFTSYLLVNKYEFYINGRTNETLYKGLNISNIQYTLIEEIFNILRISESKNNSLIFDILKEIRIEYLNLNLDNSYYKELNSINKFKLKQTICDNVYYLDNIDDNQINDIDISFNYLNIILPLIQIFI